MNWTSIISELQEQGLTQAEIARLVGTSQGHISGLGAGKRGKRLGFEIGQRLLGLHAERCPARPGIPAASA